MKKKIKKLQYWNKFYKKFNLKKQSPIYTESILLRNDVN